MLMNDDDSASNTTLCYELGKLRNDAVSIPRFRATSRLSSCLIHHCVLIRQCALGEIKISESYKMDVIKDVVKHLVDDQDSDGGTMTWYAKAAAMNSLVCMDSAAFCATSNRTLHTKIVEVLTDILGNEDEPEVSE